jgi:hypothetical protein
MKNALRGGALSAAAVLVVLAFAQPAAAGTPSVSAKPAAYMPYVTSANSTVRQLVQCGNTMYAVGAFSTVAAPGVSAQTRHNAFSFNATTGAISAWNPNPNGEVNSIALSADCAHAYLGGTFSAVQGHAVKNLAEVNVGTGAPITTFAPAPNGGVNTVVVASNRLFVGGAFSQIAGIARNALATVNLVTGAIDPYVNLNIQGNLPDSGRKVYNFALSHGGTRLLAMGSFLTVAGVVRRQIFMVDLGTTATLDPWYVPDFTLTCSPDEPLYEKSATWSPDDRFVYAVSTGGHGASPLCDTASKFSSSPSSTQAPIWINKTGCDSLYAVAADDTNVYVGGHQRWLGNPKGCDKAGPGAFSRPGVGSVSASDGSVLPWNPTRARGHGADDILLTPAGLWVASDTFFSSTKCGGQYHPGICFFPRA